MKVSLHKFCDNIDVFISCSLFRYDYIMEGNDVLMVKELEHLDLSQDSLSVYEILKCIRNLNDIF